MTAAESLLAIFVGIASGIDESTARGLTVAFLFIIAIRAGYPLRNKK